MFSGWSNFLGWLLSGFQAGVYNEEKVFKNLLHLGWSYHRNLKVYYVPAVLLIAFQSVFLGKLDFFFLFFFHVYYMFVIPLPILLSL